MLCETLRLKHPVCQCDQNLIQPENHRKGTVVMTGLDYPSPPQGLTGVAAKICLRLLLIFSETENNLL